jgi:hypothetical protein
MVHLFSLYGTDPTFSEVCGRSAISGTHNQESMAGHFANVMKQRRIKARMRTGWTRAWMTVVPAITVPAAASR